jgi:hypothetical protein
LELRLATTGSHPGEDGAQVWLDNVVVAEATPLLAAKFSPLSPIPLILRATSVPDVNFVFNRSVTGLDLPDLQLTHDGGADLLGDAQTLSSADGVNWTLSNLDTLTAAPGRYVLTLAGAGTGIADSGGGLLTVGAAVAWTNLPPIPRLPARVEFEDFDDGGEGVGYHDADAANQGGAYRPDEDVDVTATGDPAGGGHNIGWTQTGEWLAYTVDLPAAGSYILSTRLTAPADGGSFHLELDGVAIGSAVSVPNTGSYNSWRTLTTSGYSLPAGRHVLRFVFDSANALGGVGNFNWFELSAGSPAPIATAASFDYRMAPQQVIVSFNADVAASLAAGDLTVFRRPAVAGGSDTPVPFTLLGYDAGSQTVTFAASGGALPDGNYRATLSRSDVFDTNGNLLAADAVVDFFVLAGDADHDRTVGPGDFNILASHFGQTSQTWATGDFDYDGTVGPGDFNLLASRFGITLAPPPVGLAAEAPSAAATPTPTSTPTPAAAITRPKQPRFLPSRPAVTPPAARRLTAVRFRSTLITEDTDPLTEAFTITDVR